jgi:hypothetical protein
MRPVGSPDISRLIGVDGRRSPPAARVPRDHLLDHALGDDLAALVRTDRRRLV